jgi:hypothetical protein
MNGWLYMVEYLSGNLRDEISCTYLANATAGAIGRVSIR